MVAEKEESPNDRNDRAIRVAAQWYTNRIKDKQIILLTGDVANRDKAVKMGLQAMSMEQYSDSKVPEGEVKDLIVAWCAHTALDMQVHTVTLLKLETCAQFSSPCVCWVYSYIASIMCCPQCGQSALDVRGLCVGAGVVLISLRASAGGSAGSYTRSIWSCSTLGYRRA